MKLQFNKEERELLKARSPMAYIDKSLHTKLSSGRKAYLTKIWLQKTGFSCDDIKYSRNRHPYWKDKKMQGASVRNAIRSEEHDYSDGSNISWSEELIGEFIEMNKKTKDGIYIHKDWELAKHFGCSIAAVQHMRRKYNMSVRIITAKLGAVTNRRLIDYVSLGENTLRSIVRRIRRA